METKNTTRYHRCDFNAGQSFLSRSSTGKFLLSSNNNKRDEAGEAKGACQSLWIRSEDN